MLSKYKYSFFYCIATGISGACIDGVTNYMPTGYVLCLSCLISIIYFNLASKNRIKHIYKSVWQNKISFLKINIIVALMWAATFYGIAIGGATFFNLIYFASGGLFATIFSNIKSHKLKIGALVIFITLAYLTKANIFGFALAFSGGFIGFIYSKFSKDLHDQLGFSANEVLAIRFWLLFIILIIITPKHDFIEFSSFSNIGFIIIVAFLSMIIQVWLAQQGVVHSGVQINQYILTLTPFATFLAQGTILNQWHLGLLVCSLIAPIILLGDKISLLKNKI